MIVEGPVSTVSPAVAYWIAPWLRSAFEDAMTRTGREQRERMAPVAAQIVELERLRALFITAMSADVSASGPDGDRADGARHDADVRLAWVTVATAGALTEESPRQVRRLVEAGLLEGWQPARDVLVSRASIDAYLRTKEAA